LLRGGAILEIRSWGTHGGLQGLVQSSQLLDHKVRRVQVLDNRISYVYVYVVYSDVYHILAHRTRMLELIGHDYYPIFIVPTDRQSVWVLGQDYI